MSKHDECQCRGYAELLILIISAEFDPLCDDGRNYADKLRDAGVPAKFRLYKGMHGFLWMSGVLDQLKALVDEIGREVRSALW